MSNPEQSMSSAEVGRAITPETEHAKRARLISRHIETRIIGSNKSAGTEEEKEIKEYYAGMSAREKADILYGKIMAYTVDLQAELSRKQEAKKKKETFEPATSDPYLISDIKILFGDEETRKVFSETYAEARIDAKKNRLSELGTLWNDLHAEIEQKEQNYKQLEKDLYLTKISGQGKISVARSRMARLAENLSALEQRKKGIETLEGFPKITENTDAAAQFHYEQLKEYKRQMESQGKFVWLPSRQRIHQETVSAILNHRWPVLIGEAGTGKSQQANAAALELTGYLPTKLQCESVTGETQMIADVAIDHATGGSYKEYGPLMQAYTGYDDSRQEEPTVKTGRIARFDESGRLGPKAYSIIKEVRQLSPGEKLNGKKVLPGAGAIWTSNPVGPRYPERHPPDPAMRRELAEIVVPYPDMSTEKPELYEFALTALLDQNAHISIAKQELAPAYEKKEIPENQREVLADGSTVVARDELISDMSDSRHGALWRFVGGIKALQDSFVYGNAQMDKYPDTLLRFKEDADGNILITTDGTGEPLTLSTSTVTLGELASWMTGFNERRQKKDAEFRVGTLTQWLDFKINTYLKQADKADKEKIKAIFKHFHFLEGAIPDVGRVKPLTPKEIGYLSPRVPRPVYVEKPQPKTAEEEVRDPIKKVEAYQTTEVLLNTGERVLIKPGEATVRTLISEALIIRPGIRFIVGNESFIFAGIVKSKDSEQNGGIAGSLLTQKNLHRLFTPDEVESGILMYELNEIEELVKNETG